MSNPLSLAEAVAYMNELVELCHKQGDHRRQSAYSNCKAILSRVTEVKELRAEVERLKAEKAETDPLMVELVDLRAKYAELLNLTYQKIINGETKE